MGPEIILLAQLGAGSPEGARISQRQLVDAPRSYIERTVVLRDLSCVDDGTSGFLCIALVGGRGLRIEAGALGAKTSVATAEHLIEECRGAANLDRLACRFTAEITPRAASTSMIDTPSGSMPAVRVYSGEIELWRSKR